VVVFSSADGGVGRSTLVAAVGGVLALASPRPVLAVDLSGRAWGGLAHRVGGRGAASVWDAFCAARASSRVGAPLADRELIERYVHRGPTGLQALIGEAQMTRRRRPPVSDEAVILVGQLRNVYPLVLLDVPTADTSATWRMLMWATAPVLVSRATYDGLQHTMRLLSQLRAVGLQTVAERAVLVVVATTPSLAREVRAGEHQARRVAGALVRVPFDPALARPDPVDPRHLRRATRMALVEVAAAVLGLCPADPEAAQAAADPRTWQDGQAPR
jgi:MinD-like ATPase involved in chromosome partitioning or flagellar assembly